MPRLLSLALTALLACCVVTTGTLQGCSGLNYYSSQKLTLRVEIINTPASTATFSVPSPTAMCIFGVATRVTRQASIAARIPPWSHTIQMARYPSQNICLDGGFLCPSSTGTQPSGATQHATRPRGTGTHYPLLSLFTHPLIPLKLALTRTTAPSAKSGTRPPSCVPEFGDQQFCNDQECFSLPCCPGLIAIANKCRDPCQLAPQLCSNKTHENFHAI
ncbi:hypothetical protein B0H14DRAFT_2581481 [Mycena olivaceomarginata]|nr:hypothetical protein B0H14DRAFT_2581481 [Mycena olivaceomarginata]